jgi:hypothetical protein
MLTMCISIINIMKNCTSMSVWATTTLNMLTLNEIALQTYQFKQEQLQFTVRNEPNQSISNLQSENNFLYNFFLSTLLSNHATIAKAAVRGGQAAKGRRRGSQKCRRRAGGGEATWWPDSGGGGARAERRSGPNFRGERSCGACGRVGVGRGGSRGSCDRSRVERAGRQLCRTQNTFRAVTRVRFSFLVGVLGRAKVWVAPYCTTLGPPPMPI